jgi:arabinofuranosyltransferase
MRARAAVSSLLRPPRAGTLLVTLALIAFGVVLLRTAWLTDDAYITFRTVDNLIHGYGLTWNTNERVQVYTHPLWMFLISVFYFFTREIFLTAIFVSVATSLAAVAIVGLRIAATGALGLLAIAIFVLSRPFVDYSTSGLENPLTHLLLAAFLLVFLKHEWTPRTLLLLSFLVSLGMLNRMDLALLLGPALALAWVQHRSWRATGALLLGLTPFVAWLVFSLVYYGFLFPNTAYAKLGAGIDAFDLAYQGLRYLANGAIRDPLTVLVIGTAFVIVVARRELRGLAVMAGVALYFLYVVKIGGDFMSGRFFTAPLLAAVAVLVWRPGAATGFAAEPGNPTSDRARWPPGSAARVAPALVGVFAIAFATPYPTLRTGTDYGQSKAGAIDYWRISDERRFYFQQASLLQYRRNPEMPIHRFAHEGRALRALGEPLVREFGSVGYRGFFAGPDAHIIDHYALGDPLLARLPARYDPEWRVGHFARFVPLGYHAAAAWGEETLTDAALAEYYEHLRRIVRGPIWNAERWNTIWAMHRGRYDHLIDRDAYRFPFIARVSIGDEGGARLADTPWNSPGTLVIGSRGLHVDLGGVRNAPEWEIGLTAGNAYHLLFMLGDKIVHTAAVERIPGEPRIRRYRVSLPPLRARIGYDALRILPGPGDDRHSLGYLVPVEG